VNIYLDYLLTIKKWSVEKAEQTEIKICEVKSFSKSYFRFLFLGLTLKKYLNYSPFLFTVFKETHKKSKARHLDLETEIRTENIQKTIPGL
jgi:hypothetical protein